MTKLAAIICVRMTSSRLPGKALVIYDTVSQSTNLGALVNRVQTSRYQPEIVVATSTDVSDDPILAEVDKINFLPNSKISVVRGSLSNVVERFNLAISTLSSSPDYIWRVMADCPLVDINLVDWRVDVLSRNHADLMTIIQPEPTYAAQASIWSKEAWDYCAKHSSGSMLEHPGEYLYENLSQFKSLTEPGPENIYYQPIRTELDTPEDLEFFRQVWGGLGKQTPSTKDALNWLSTHPEVTALNSKVELKTKSTHLHGHHRARKFICQNEECKHTIAYKINDALEVTCQKCGMPRRFYP